MVNKADNWKRQAIIFLLGQTISLFGSSIVQFTISWHITLTTKSGLMMTIATLCGFLPQLIISFFGGVWADRFNRKFIIIIADAIIALCTTILAILFAFGYTQIWLLFIISAIRSAGAGVQMPAVSALLPDIVPEEKLMRVNGINSSLMSFLMLISPAAAGALYNFLGLGIALWVDVITAAIGISLMLLLHIQYIKNDEINQNFLNDLKSGIAYVFSTKWLKQFLSFYLIYSLMFGPVIFLTPLMVARSFGPESWRLVIHEMIFAIGSLLGGIAVSSWGGFKNKTITLLVSSTAFGFTTMIMGFSPNFIFYLVVMFFMGTTIPFINTGYMTVLQTKVEPEYMGRVFGLSSIIGSTGMPLSMAFFGPLADIMKIEIQLIITGSMMIIICIFMLRFKELIAAGEPVLAKE